MRVCQFRHGGKVSFRMMPKRPARGKGEEISDLRFQTSDWWAKCQSEIGNLKSSVPRHSRLNFDGPLVDAAGHALSVREPLLAEPSGDPRAPPAMMAVDDDPRARERRQLIDPLLNLAHRHEPRPVDRDQEMLVGFAAVEQDDLAVGF